MFQVGAGFSAMPSRAPLRDSENTRKSTERRHGVTGLLTFTDALPLLPRALMPTPYHLFPSGGFLAPRRVKKNRELTRLVRLTPPRCNAQL